MSAATTPTAAAHHQAAIDRAAALCDLAADEADLAIDALGADDSTKPAADAMYRALCAVNDARNVLVTKCGAQSAKATATRADSLDLAGLALLSDPAAPQLLALLEQAQAVAEGIDARRGRAVPVSVPLGPGEARGTDLAETISEIALRLRVDIHGPAGRD